MRKHVIAPVAALAMLLTAVAAWIAVGATSASATEGGDCTPAVTAQHYSWTGGPRDLDEGAPPTPAEDPEDWQANTSQEPHYKGGGTPAQKPDDSDYVDGDSGLHYTSHGSSGKADWFYFRAATPAQGDCNTPDASFAESVTPATCDSGEVLTFSGTNVDFSEESPITGPAEGVDVTATPQDGHDWTDGGSEARTVFEGDLSGPLTEGCQPPPPGEASASVVLDTAANCDSPSTVKAVTEHATLEGTLDESVGDHVATFDADQGFAFEDDAATLDVPYTIEAATGDCPKPPHGNPPPHNPPHGNPPHQAAPPTAVDAGLAGDQGGRQGAPLALLGASLGGVLALSGLTVAVARKQRGR